MKKIIGIILCLILSAGCGRRQEAGDTITVWHWMTDRDKAIQELARQYKTRTGIKVNVELFAPSDIYSKKIVASAQAKILPDIYGILDTKETFSKFIKYGYVADLTAEFQENNAEWSKGLFVKAVDSNRFVEGNVYGINPGIYGVSLDVTNIQMLYNKDLLKKAGYTEPPGTFAEFIEVVQALKRVGIPGMVSGWGELWMMDCFASNYAFNIMGEEKVMATYKGEVSYTDKDWIRVFNIFKELRDNEAFVKGIVTKPNKEAEQDFALGRAAFAFNGSWSVNVYNDMNPNLNYGAMLPPSVNPERPMMIWGGAGSSLVVNGFSPNKAKAIDFLKWLTAEEQQAFLAKETKNLPSNRQALSAIPKVLEEFARSMDRTTHPTIWELEELPMVKEKFAKGLQSILIGKKTPEEVASEVQEVKIKEREKAKRRRR